MVAQLISAFNSYNHQFSKLFVVIEYDLIYPKKKTWWTYLTFLKNGFVLNGKFKLLI